MGILPAQPSCSRIPQITFLKPHLASSSKLLGRMPVPERLTTFTELYLLSVGAGSTEKNSRMLLSGSLTRKNRK